MSELRERDVASLLELIGESNALLEVSAFRTGILPPLRRMVPCAMATYNEVELGERAVSLIDPPEAMTIDDPGELLARVGASNPLVAHYARSRDGRARKISDFIDRGELHRRAIWREAFRPLGVEYQIAFGLPSQPTLVIGIALSDGDSDFSERDRRLLNLARPHLLQAYRNSQLYTGMKARLAAVERGLDAAGQGVLLLRRDDRIETVSVGARRLLARYFGSRVRTTLPGPLAGWIADRRKEGIESAPSRPLVIPGADQQLVVRYLPARVPQQSDVLLLEAKRDPLAVTSLEALGLTRRESEVLRGVAFGESNEEIAAALAVTVATVRKHLEHVYAKLSVTSRASAAATAWAGAEARAMVDEPAA